VRQSEVRAPATDAPAPGQMQDPVSAERDSRAMVPARGSGRAAMRGTFAALDLGTNNCRLLIAKRRALDWDRAKASDDFTVVDAYSRVVRLGEGLMQSGKLSNAAMDRALVALRACADKLAKRGVSQVRSVATEACRRAENAPDFVKRVYDETGLALDVITPAEEARLAVLGCQTLIDLKSRRTLVFDIGGGSTEVVLVERRNMNQHRDRPRRNSHMMKGWVSIPWGVVSLAETELLDAGNPMARLEAYGRMKARVASHLRPMLQQLGSSGLSEVQLLGASGTVTTLASLNMGLAQYDRRKVDGAIASTAELRALSHDLAVRSPDDRAKIPGIGPDRADLVVAGCAILEALLDLTTAPQLRVADRGIREGILRSMMARDSML